MVRLFGVPNTILHDRDVRFTSQFWTAFFELIGSKVLFTSAYHPQMDGQMEQMHKVVELVLRTMATDIDAKWVDRLGFVEFSINNSIKSSTWKAPFELAYGTNVRHVVDHLDGIHSVAIAQDLVTSITKLIGEARRQMVKV